MLLRPAPDLDASVVELRARCVADKARDWIRDGIYWLARRSSDGLDEQLATRTVYTVGRSPAQVASDNEMAKTLASDAAAAGVTPSGTV